MLSVKSTTLKKTKPLHNNCLAFLVFFFSFFFLGLMKSLAQDNSPYSRYGLGDLVPSTNITSRGMGGITAAYNDPLTINYNNPATYGHFLAYREPNSKKLASGRVLLDVGMNFENRSLREKTITEKFTASNALFSHLQLGIPLSTKWGIGIGLRPISRISYKIDRYERLIDPNTQQPIDSALTQFRGNGGSYLASIGTGYKFSNKLSLGFNFGYLFGEKDYSTRRTFINDTVVYQQSNFQTKTSFGKIYIDAGILYQDTLNKSKDKSKRVLFSLGAYGNLSRKLEASMDVIHETFVHDPTYGDVRVDSVSDQKDVKGKIIYPATIGIGFSFEKPLQVKKGGWQFGMDFVQTNWSQYRFYNQIDSVKSKWELRMGGQLWPSPKKSFFSNVVYRAGFFIGPDYIKINGNLPQYGVSFGMGLPIVPSRGFGRNQYTLINVALEYIKRGNNNNLLRENLFRLSVGLSLSDIWFLKQKYE
jgi:hypothetical protein